MKRLKIIKLIIFDLSEVLMHGLLNSFADIEKITNQEITTDSFDRVLIKKLFLGKISESYFLDHSINGNKWKISKKELKKIIRQNFIEIPGMLEFVRYLGKKYRVVLLSNHAKEWIRDIEKKTKLKDIFSECYYSFELGLIKPDVDIFKIVVEKMNVKPSETLFIDDQQENIIAAKKMGINVILFDGLDNFKKQFKKYE